LCLTFSNVITVGAVDKKTTDPQDFNETLYAKSAVLMDADSGRILYSKNGDEQLAMASTTKIMTLIVALENVNTDDIITFSKYASSMPDVQLNALKGEQFVLKDILYSLMLESHNDSAAAIAEYVGSGAFTNKVDANEVTSDQSKEYIKAFTKMMNQKARDIGCFNSFFITPNGLDAQVTLEDGSVKVHSTTAKDLATIMSYCINKSSKKEQFLEITRTASYSFHNIITKEDGSVECGSRSFSCNNHNAFLNMMDGALSGKTGFTCDAGYCYVGALERDGRTFVVALLACGWPNNKSYKWSDTKKLMNYGIENYEFHSFNDVVIDEAEFEPIMVKNGQTKSLGELAYSGVEMISDVNSEEYYNTKLQSIENEEGTNDTTTNDTSTNNTSNDIMNSTDITINGVLLRNDEKINVVYEIKDELEAPINEGDSIGMIKYVINGETWKVKNVVLTDTVKRIDFKWCVDQVFDKLLL
jgi:D-alanyl-D-alanine carboxypeptidase (penicillin-binding protein 5/6)